MEVPERNGLMKNKLLIHSKMWMNLKEKFVLRERKNKQKIAKYFITPFI